MDRNTQDAAHAKARLAWEKTSRGRSPVDGLAEMVRNEAAAVPKPRAKLKRVAERAMFLARLKDSYNRAMRRVAPPTERSNYFPHQGPQECARRLRQMATA